MRPGSGQCCVMELSPAGYHGTQLDFSIPLGLVSPLIGVVTNVGSDHISAFGSEDAIAAAKGKLIEVLPKNGVAVLNADDARVLAMRERCAGRVITYGLAADANVRAENVSSRWPARLSMTVSPSRCKHNYAANTGCTACSPRFRSASRWTCHC